MTLAVKAPCTSCRAAISFGVTGKGKRMPLDVEPVVLEPKTSPGGDPQPLTVRDLLGLQVFTDRAAIRQATPEDVAAGALIYRPHFATCPSAAQHRRG